MHIAYWVGTTLGRMIALTACAAGRGQLCIEKAFASEYRASRSVLVVLVSSSVPGRAASSTSPTEPHMAGFMQVREFIGFFRFSGGPLSVSPPVAGTVRTAPEGDTLEKGPEEGWIPQASLQDCSSSWLTSHVLHALGDLQRPLLSG